MAGFGSLWPMSQNVEDFRDDPIGAMIPADPVPVAPAFGSLAVGAGLNDVLKLTPQEMARGELAEGLRGGVHWAGFPAEFFYDRAFGDRKMSSIDDMAKWLEQSPVLRYHNKKMGRL